MAKNLDNKGLDGKTHKDAQVLNIDDLVSKSKVALDWSAATSMPAPITPAPKPWSSSASTTTAASKKQPASSVAPETPMPVSMLARPTKRCCTGAQDLDNIGALVCVNAESQKHIAEIQAQEETHCLIRVKELELQAATEQQEFQHKQMKHKAKMAANECQFCFLLLCAQNLSISTSHLTLSTPTSISPTLSITTSLSSIFGTNISGNSDLNFYLTLPDQPAVEPNHFFGSALSNLHKNMLESDTLYTAGVGMDSWDSLTGVGF